MSARHNESHYQDHQRAAELHDKAAHAHRAAAEHKDKQDQLTGQEQSRHALEHSQHAYLYTQQVHQKATNGHGITLFGHQEIATLAHELWRARGCPEGSPDVDWFQAVGQLRSGK